MPVPAKPANFAEAKVLSQSNWWKGMAPREIVAFQLYEPFVCMDWDSFELAVCQALGRPVCIHEYADSNALRQEFDKTIPAPTWAQSIEKFSQRCEAKKTPAEKWNDYLSEAGKNPNA